MSDFASLSLDLIHRDMGDLFRLCHIELNDLLQIDYYT